MDPTDLLKSVSQLQTIATTIVAGVPIAEIVKRIVLPSADSLGERLKSRVERCFEKSAKMLDDAESTVQAVSDKLVIEILQGASLEEDEDLHTMFASLLANAASAENAGKVHPGFVSILKQMSPDEAKVLKRHSDELAGSQQYFYSGFDPFRKQLFDMTVERLSVALDGLVAAQLVRRPVLLTRHDDDVRRPPTIRDIELEEEGPYHMTDRGKAFLECCTPPKAAEE